MQRLGSAKGFFGRPPKRERLAKKIQTAVVAQARLAHPQDAVPLFLSFASTLATAKRA
jgi:hypothetical protein